MVQIEKITIYNAGVVTVDFTCNIRKTMQQIDVDPQEVYTMLDQQYKTTDAVEPLSFSEQQKRYHAMRAIVQKSKEDYALIGELTTIIDTSMIHLFPLLDVTSLSFCMPHELYAILLTGGSHWHVVFHPLQKDPDGFEEEDAYVYDYKGEWEMVFIHPHSQKEVLHLVVSLGLEESLNRRS
jgi:hypothetical protein